MAKRFICFKSTRSPHPKDGQRAWLVLAYSTFCELLVGAMSFGYGIVLPLLMKSFGENRERTALVGSLQNGVGLFLCVLTSTLCERFSCRLTNAVGLASYAVGLTLSSLCRSVYPLYLTYSVLVGFGMACVFISDCIVVRLYFVKYYSVAMGIMLTGGGIGALSVGPVMQALTDRFGWENTFRILAGVFAFLLLFVFVMDPNVEQCETTTVTTVETENSAANLVKPRKIVLGFLDVSVWTFPEFTISVIGVFLGYFGHFSALIHVGKYASELGISPSKGSMVFLIIGIATTVSRLITGGVCDYIKPRFVHQAAAILSGISTIMLSFATSYTHLVIFAIFYGFADGPFRFTVNILFMNTVDVPRKPTAFGQSNMVVSISNAAGPAVAGMMADQSGSYASAFYMAGATTILGGAIFFVHLCFFKTHPSQRKQVNITRPGTDHPLARVGPGTDQPLAGVGLGTDHPLARVGPGTDHPLARVGPGTDQPLAGVGLGTDHPLARVGPGTDQPLAGVGPGTDHPLAGVGLGTDHPLARVGPGTDQPLAGVGPGTDQPLARTRN